MRTKSFFFTWFLITRNEALLCRLQSFPHEKDVFAKGRRHDASAMLL